MQFAATRMKRRHGGVLIASLLFMLLFLRYGMVKNAIGESYLNGPVYFNGSNPLEWVRATGPPEVQKKENVAQVISVDTIIFNLFSQRNFSGEEQQSLSTWNLLKQLVNQSQSLPSGAEAFKDATNAWGSLMASVQEERLGFTNESAAAGGKSKQCPHFLNKMSTTELDHSGYKLRLPCGLTQGSSITIIGIPSGLLGNFRIDMTGEALPGEPDPPIILHYNVRLNGDQLTEDPVIVQNTWTIAHDWGEEERCPPSSPEDTKKVDELDRCNKMVGKDNNGTASKHINHSRRSPIGQEGSKGRRRYFPFKQSYLSVATLRVGLEGIQMTVDGKHATSFAFRETLEPWLVNQVKITGDLKVISVLASGLPTSEDPLHAIDLEALKSVPLSHEKPLDLFIGVFSTANNFKRRMTVRRTWMQYDAVRSGAVAVRFFVGLHKNHIVNEELWNEAKTYGDIQLMPFVDYYSLITWKTLAICIFGTEVSAKFVMKTDDDAFVRVDEVLTSLTALNVTHGLLYGLINLDSQPHRDPDSKWYISPEEWPEETYPPWAHGPGYAVSHDIANAVYKKYREGQLKMFRLEDVAMGIWIADIKKDGLEVRYQKDERIFNEGCKDWYVVAHYQSPRELMCLWQKLQETKRARCCGD